MSGIARLTWPHIAPRTALDWLPWHSAALVVILFIGGKVTERLVLGRRWHSFGRLDLAELLLLAVAVGAFAWYVQRRMRRELDRAEEQRRHAEALADENAAVVRAVGAVVREFAQPLSGALSYSELLMMRADTLRDDERHELTRLRDGVLCLDQLLQTVRRTLNTAPTNDANPHVADVVEESITPARLRQ